jgi:MoaA/NifB/PqqE/SkfB family radical SAM enzyme
LRGKAEDLSMSKQTIQNALKDVERINCIQFTGGEPTMGLYQIRTILEAIKDNNISVGWFWIKTNGSKFSKALINYFAEFQEYVDEPDMSGFEFSVDQFHKDNRKIVNKYLHLAECYEWIQAPKRSNLYYLFREGRAKKEINGVHYKNPYFYSGWCKPEEYYLKQYSAVAWEYPVYISANGNVICGCDLSCKHIDKYSFGNVNKRSLKDIILERIAEHPEQIFPK